MNENTPKPTGHHDVARILRDQILHGVFSNGDKLPTERNLVERFDVARGTIREALSLLAREGLVTTKRGSGTYILRQQAQIIPVMQSTTPLELMDARFALEPHICRLAVVNARPKHLEQGQELIMKMDKAIKNPTAFAAADSAFHLLLVEATGNHLLISIMKQIDAIRHQEAWARMRNLTLNEKSMSGYNEEHKEILKMIAARASEKGAIAMKTHLKSGWLALTGRSLV